MRGPSAVMKFTEVVAAFEKLEATSSRLDTTRLLAELFKATPKSELHLLVNLLQGKVGPDWEAFEFGLADKMIVRAIGQASGSSQVDALYKEIGDLGEVAKKLMGAPGKQSSLFGPAPLTLKRVFDELTQLTKISGQGSQESKMAIVTRILVDSKPEESNFVIRIVLGKLRLGVADMTILDALAFYHRDAEVKSVTGMSVLEREEQEHVRATLERGYDHSSQLSEVARQLAEGGLEAVSKLSVKVGVPLRAMAAERSKTIEDILERHNQVSAVEDKYDGLRIQAHVKRGGGTRLFSRRLEELTDQFPDAIRYLEASLKVDEAIVEGECIAIDIETGALRPFQEISRRRGRKTGLGEAGAVDMTKEVPVSVYLFDALQVGGEVVMHEPYAVRREKISEAFRLGDRVHASEMTICRSVAEIETVFQDAVARGAEGVMCKSLEGKYKAGNRGFDWIKFKTDYTADLVDTMDLVAIGAFQGRGRRAGWYGALLMATYNSDKGIWESICKLGTGFDDATLMSLKGKFEPHVSVAKPKSVSSQMVPDVWFEPALVMEVEAAEISLSPTHLCGEGLVKPGIGFAARFPRFTGRWRDDKSAEIATTHQEILGMFEAQGKK